MLVATQSEINKALVHLKKNDPVLKHLINSYPKCNLKPHTDYYGALVTSIIGQQLSLKAAAAIRKRLLELFNGKMPTPKQLLAVSTDQLRSIGFSQSKARYVHDLADHIIKAKLSFDLISEQSNEEIIAALTDVKGIGEWTAHMFLIFCVGRLDVLPRADLGIRNAIRNLYKFSHAPTLEQIVEIATLHNWHPYESVASWYAWRSLEN